MEHGRERGEKHLAYKTFPNNEKGFISLIDWVKKQTVTEYPLRFVMEATGVYHEPLAYFLSGKSYTVSIIMSHKITNFFKTLEIKTVTDKSMSSAIALFGLEKSPADWEPPKSVFRELRQLTRERDQLIAERTMLKNQLHAEQAEAWPGGRTIARLKDGVNFINERSRRILSEIKMALDDDAGLNKTIETITSIPGVGLLTAVVVLAETNDFELIKSKKQLTSYAGLVIKEKESGISVKGKPKISKRGNKYLRKAMYLPALAAIRYSSRYKAIFVRIVSRNWIKMKGGVAVQRKLLEMIFTMYKTKTVYQEDYLQKLAGTQSTEKSLNS